MTAVEFFYDILTKENWEYKTYEEQDEIFQKVKQMEKEQIEISDEEIEKAIIDQDIVKQEGYCHCFLEGAKWYREQLKKK